MQIEGRGENYGVFHFLFQNETASSCPIIELLQAQLKLPPERLKELIHLGSIYLNQKRCLDACTRLKKGDHVRIHTEPRRFSYPDKLVTRIVTTHPDYYVVNKPAGVPTHALVDNRRENVLSFLEQELDEKLFITHRLDLETSGHLLIARNLTAQAHLNRAISERKIKRTYNVWISAPVPPGTYVHFMEPSPKAPKRISHAPLNGWLRCELSILKCTRSDSRELGQLWLTNKALNNLYRLEVVLGTGRSQQIRAQLAHLNSPIVGDVRYGSPFTLQEQTSLAPAIALNASRIEF